jgi:hypothetical protein
MEDSTEKQEKKERKGKKSRVLILLLLFLTATPKDASVYLNWAAVAGATSYTVLRSTTSGGPYASIATATTTRYKIKK